VRWRLVTYPYNVISSIKITHVFLNKGHALAKEYEAIDNYGSVFEVLAKAKQRKRPKLNF
jgi:hypothetical protein